MEDGNLHVLLTAAEPNVCSLSIFAAVVQVT